MYYSNEKILSFLIEARNGKLVDNVLAGALRFTECIPDDVSMHDYLNRVNEGRIADIVNRMKKCVQHYSTDYLVGYGVNNSRVKLTAIGKYFKNNIDELLILSALFKVQYDLENLTDFDSSIIEALRRSNNIYQNMSMEEIGEHLSSYSPSQLDGVVNNVKGIAHEIKFTKTENIDGDNFLAKMFEDTNHPGTDVSIRDILTGKVEEIQLKATDDQSYIEDWISKHPEGKVVVTEEIAEKLGLQSSNISNHEITCDTEEVIDKLINSADNDSVWKYFPLLSTASLAVVCYGFWQKHRKGQIDSRTLKVKCAKATGGKVVKFALLSTLLSIPGIGFVTGVYLSFKMISNIKLR